MTKRYAARQFYEDHLHDDTDECIIWPFSVGSHGYGQLRVNGVPLLVHTLACIEHHGPRPKKGMEAAHTCGNNRKCFNGRHLIWKTKPENQADRLRDGTHQLGSQNTQAKLTEDDVRTIRELLKHQSHRSIARQYNVSPATIDDLAAGRTWGWLT